MNVRFAFVKQQHTKGKYCNEKGFTLMINSGIATWIFLSSVHFYDRDIHSHHRMQVH